jgi:pilus assembly protein CpaE
MAMRMSDVILLIAQLELTSLRNVVRMLHTLGQEENTAEKVRVIVNRVGSEEGEITLKKAEETIGRPIFWQVPNDYKAMLGARNAGVPLLTHSPKCKVQLSLIQLASTLCGKTPLEPPKKEKKGFFSFR